MSTSDGYVIGTTKVVDPGPDSARGSLVILGDGYHASELAAYHTDVQNFLTSLRATLPYDELFARSMCNELMSCQPIVVPTILAVPAEWQQQQKPISTQPSALFARDHRSIAC
jgi:hypothetical protein